MLHDLRLLRGMRGSRTISTMPALSAQLILSILGPLFLLLGAWRCIRAGGLVPQGRTWLIIGLIFSVVATYLWWTQGAPR
jgi:hypothetical protein